MSAPSRLDAYLAWQAEIGTPEVVLPEPWAGNSRRAPAIATAPDIAEASEESPTASAPASRHAHAKATTSVPASPEDFFRDIERKLAEPARKKAEPKPGPAVPPEALRPPSELPGSPDAYWAWLDAEYPRWFPGLASPLVRASEPQGKGAGLAVVELFPSGGALFGGEPGALFDKMMQAIGLSRADLYLTSVMKTPPPGRSWARKDVARALPGFLRELELAGCATALLLGEACAQSVLRTGKSLAALEDFAEIAAPGAPGPRAIAGLAAWHPADLLRDASLKAPAWARLKALKAELERKQT